MGGHAASIRSLDEVLAGERIRRLAEQPSYGG
jgi:hypothetical protein